VSSSHFGESENPGKRKKTERIPGRESRERDNERNAEGEGQQTNTANNAELNCSSLLLTK
jgi:hypothetical protein